MLPFCSKRHFWSFNVYYMSCQVNIEFKEMHHSCNSSSLYIHMYCLNCLSTSRKNQLISYIYLCIFALIMECFNIFYC